MGETPIPGMVTGRKQQIIIWGGVIQIKVTRRTLIRNRMLGTINDSDSDIEEENNLKASSEDHTAKLTNAHLLTICLLRISILLVLVKPRITMRVNLVGRKLREKTRS
ncbi:hypothetical protein RDI58_022552 [Solanum bulbocastanum]|uniref:Uncharacterized protein n=1 Tax=Solanum bulbocastanum TaxID=147425 RepID=A0AAN8T9H3_SOLBU